ncbi:sugar transporter ERD6-like 4 [Nematostella vectensis]|nr:sugar transporter ERD6-like 4 [Nematostella vectensis]
MGKTENFLTSSSINVEEKVSIISPQASVQVPLKGKEQIGHVILATFLAALGSICFGFSLGYSSPALEDIEKEKDGIRLDQNEGALFSSLVTLGALASSPLGGFIVDRFGRKATLMLSAVPSELGWLLIAFAQNHAMMYAGRFIAGLGIGLIAVAVPTYIAEISSAKLRGALGSVHQLSITAGLLLAYIFGVFFKWRAIALAGAIIPGVLVVLMFCVPETPRWFLGHNERGAALKSLEWFRGPNGDIEQECFEIECTLDTHEKLTFSEFLRPAIRNP